MITPAYGLTASERVLPKLALDWTTGVAQPGVDVVRAGVATFVGSDGFLQDATADTQRIDFTTGVGGLLVEESRANLIKYSNKFDESVWTLEQLTVVPNAAIGPDGTMSAWKLVESTSTSTRNIRQTAIAISSGATVAYTFFAKAGERSVCIAQINDNATTANRVFATFNLLTGAVTSPTNGGTFTGVSAKTTALKDGWYRCELTGTATGVSSVQGRLFMGATSYTGDGTSGLYLFGEQLEAGAFPTSYIPTEASAVTRNADVATMTGANFSDWYNQAEGTFEAIWSRNATLTTAYSAGFPRVFEVSDGTTNNLIYLSGNASSVNEVAQLTVGGSVITTRTAAVVAANTAANSVFAYKTGFISLAQNGATPSTSTAAFTAPAMTTLYLGNRNGAGRALNGHLRKLSFYKQALTSAEVQAFSK